MRVHSFVIAAALALLATGALAADKKESKAVKGVPRIDIALPALPSLDGVKNPTDPGALPKPAEEAGPPVLEKVQHARDFDANHGGRRPRGGVIEKFQVAGLPTTTEAFKTLVRVKSPGGKPLTLKLALKNPAGEVVADTMADVSYEYGQSVKELVIKWDGIQAKTAGTYTVEVSAGELKLGAAGIEVVFGG